MSKANQHYVSKVYLKSWGRSIVSNVNGKRKVDYKVYCIDKNNLDKSNDLFTTEILFDKYLYTITPDIRMYFNDYENVLNDLSDECQLIEDSFDKLFENNYEEDIRKFVNEVKQKKNKAIIMINEKTAINIYKAYIIMAIRNPNFDYFGCLGAFNELLQCALKNIEDKTYRQGIIDVWGKVLWLKNSYKALFNLKTGTANGFLELMKDIGSIALYEIENGSDVFLTSDYPAFIDKALCNPNAGNWGYFPISPKQILIFGKQGIGEKSNIVFYKVADKEFIKKINNIVVKNSNEKIISSIEKVGDIL